MKYENIPNINVLQNEYLTSKQIRSFLGISKDAFTTMELVPMMRVGKTPVYSKEDLINKIGNRLEIYQDCEFAPGFPNYLVSKSGDVYSVYRKIIPLKFKPKVDRYGYKVVTLINENGRTYIAVHRVVALTYLPNPLNLPTVNHKDGDKNNNDVENLEWCTQKYNLRHAFDKNLNKTGIENHGSVPIIAYKNCGELDAIFENVSSCAAYYGLSEATVRDSHDNGTTKGKYGYYFRKISKETFYQMKEDEQYEKYFIPYVHATRCTKNSQHIA